MTMKVNGGVADSYGSMVMDGRRAVEVGEIVKIKYLFSSDNATREFEPVVDGPNRLTITLPNLNPGEDAGSGFEYSQGGRTWKVMGRLYRMPDQLGKSVYNLQWSVFPE